MHVLLFITQVTPTRLKLHSLFSKKVGECEEFVERVKGGFYQVLLKSQWPSTGDPGNRHR